MIGHAFRLDLCDNDVHEDDGQYSITIHPFFCGRIPRRYPHIQQNLGRASKAHSTSIVHPMTTQVKCQPGKVLIRHQKNSIFRVHCG